MTLKPRANRSVTAGGNTAPAMGSGASFAVCNATDQKLCPGNQFEYCGGAGFMNVYYSPVLKE